MSKVNYYSILSGTSAAGASFFGKLCGLPIFQGFFIVRVVFFGLMLLCNGSVWTLYVKALQSTNSTLTATVLSSAVNYLLSAILGYIVFGEITSLLWWTGLSSVLVGVVLITQDQEVASMKLNAKCN
ncbi:hypothetical protein PPYR_09815 [Photinus pyralis]|uniref:EamA domain-containing protein n=1 Tax=Photinus pyralis TaxID=7054 RepID=A0A5N4AEM4_PHOPY|nr:hypothetical protein PPYR_09815 [Photinus pyralis]